MSSTDFISCSSRSWANKREEMGRWRDVMLQWREEKLRDEMTRWRNEMLQWRKEKWREGLARWRGKMARSCTLSYPCKMCH